MEHIREDLEELSEVFPKNLSRLTVANGDPLALPTHKLLEISDLIHEYFPKIYALTCQSSIRNIMRKSQDELNELYQAKYDDLYIGIETGSDNVLKLLNKGYTSAQAYETLEKLENSKMKYISLLMGGAGGKDYSKEHVLETAKLLSRYPPKMISIITTGIVSGTKLAEMQEKGEFKQLTEREIIQEEIDLIKHLEVPNNVYFFGHHNNNVAKVSGHMKNKDKIIENFEKKLEEIPNEILDSCIKREYL